jgi:hypothetical protein
MDISCYDCSTVYLTRNSNQFRLASGATAQIANGYGKQVPQPHAQRHLTFRSATRIPERELRPCRTQRCFHAETARLKSPGPGTRNLRTGNLRSDDRRCRRQTGEEHRGASIVPRLPACKREDPNAEQHAGTEPKPIGLAHDLAQSGESASGAFRSCRRGRGDPPQHENGLDVSNLEERRQREEKRHEQSRSDALQRG